MGFGVWGLGFGVWGLSSRLTDLLGPVTRVQKKKKKKVRAGEERTLQTWSRAHDVGIERAAPLSPPFAPIPRMPCQRIYFRSSKFN